MNSDRIIDAIGMIDQELVYEAKNIRKIKSAGTKKLFALVAAIIICILFAVTALGLRPFYKEIYKTAEQIIQQLKPVKISCVDNGIKMEVISASVVGNEAFVYISMQDLNGERIDESYDLFDSYGITGSFDSYGFCEKVDYDDNTKMATFLVTIGRSDGKKMKDGKISFSVNHTIGNKREFNGFLEKIDWSKTDMNPDIDIIKQAVFPIQENGKMSDRPVYADFKYLVPQGEFYITPTGAVLTGIGYIDDMLHIQFRYSDRDETDKMGFLYFQNKAGTRIHTYDMEYIQDWEMNEKYTENKKTWVEYVFDISPEKLAEYIDTEEYRLFGEFWTYDASVYGDWSVTFNIEDIY